MRFVLITVILALVASAASAETVSVIGNRPDSRGGYITRKVDVDLGSLDRNKSEDAPAIMARLKDGARQVCTPREHIDFELAPRVERCQKRTLANTLYLMNAPELAKFADSK